MNSTSHLHSTPLRRSALAVVIAVLALLVLVGPTPRADANPPFDPVEPEIGLDYGGSAGTVLDLYVPDFPGTAKLPLLIWSNGCAWLAPPAFCGVAGTAGIAAEFNPRGYAVAGVGIASSSGAAFPTQLHDIRAAIRWLRQHAADYNLDPNRFAIMGFSSGGWTSVIAGTTSDDALPGEPNTNGLANGVSSAVQAAVGFSSPTDFLQMDAWFNAENCGSRPLPPPWGFDFFPPRFDLCSAIQHDRPLNPLPLPGVIPIATASPESLLVGCTGPGVLLGIQACPDDTQAANPIKYVQGSEVPTLLLHGFVDPLVPHGQSELLYEALAAAGNEVTFISAADAGHSPDQIRASQSVTVFHTNRGGNETIRTGSASWETIEHFIHVALSRA